MIKREFLEIITDKDYLEDLMRNAIDYIYAPKLCKFKKYYTCPTDENIPKDFEYCMRSYKTIKRNKFVRMSDDDIIDTFNSVKEWA